MARRQIDPLRPLTTEELEYLVHISRARAEPASHVARAKALLAVAEGRTYTEAARLAGCKSGDAVSQLVSRFNREGLAALEPGHGGGAVAVYTLREQERILAEARRTPDREADGAATWSLSILRRALRTAPDGLPRVSTHTIWNVLKEAGWSWRRGRTWCDTGTVMRRRKGGSVEVTDPDATPKKT
jgi:transposase